MHKVDEIHDKEAYITRLARHFYGLKGEAKQLVGQVDLNFYFKSTDGKEYVLKLSHAEADIQNLDLQNSMMLYLAKKDLPFQLPMILPNKEGKYITEIHQGYEASRFLRLLNWVPGRVFAKVNPHSTALLINLGKVCGLLDAELAEFDHPGAHRKFKWDVAQTFWVKESLDCIKDPDQNALARHFFHYFEKEIFPRLNQLRQSVIYNDPNDYNILVSDDLQKPEIEGLIDFGDAVFTQTINELAIAITYAAMDKPDPLEAALSIVRGYHSVYPIQEEELAVLYGLVAARLLISVTSSAINKNQFPDNEYLLISEQPAWDLLQKWRKINPDFAHYSFRNTCDLEPCPMVYAFHQWASNNPGKYSFVLGLSIENYTPLALDLSVGSPDLGNNTEFDIIEAFELKIASLLSRSKAKLGYGGYDEVRPFYSTDAYMEQGNAGSRWRSVHLGFDLWAEAGTPVLAFADGLVHSFANNEGERNYGPTIILQHRINSDQTFYTLYGHLNAVSLEKLEKGGQVKKGQQIGIIGAPSENGNWPPHLHFQIMLDTLGWEGDFPGVSYFDQKEVWKSICPDPTTLLGFSSQKDKALDPQQILIKRSEKLGKSLSVSYQKPLKILRGYQQYLYDHTGRRYLDTVNNVPHVGHQHPRVVKAAQRQMAVLNTNTRYLHDNIIKYAEELLATFPPELCVCHFVNSGSEANELAIRMTRAYTGQKDMLVVEAGYHGNTENCINISSYKFDGKGGKGAPDHVHVMPIPDTFRGLYRGNEAGIEYASHFQETIQTLQKKGKGIAGFICESILSCGGQIVLPENYLKTAYEYVRNAGGLCIADEVQVGFGRVGSTFWGFELQGVIPDIVTMGKPIGNGHPLAAVVTTKAVAEAFANGMEFFNTFGGNPVSCAIGREVLAIIKDEKLQENALKVGAYLRKRLLSLQEKYPVIGDVRGLGFFQGFELIKAGSRLQPAPDQASYLANRMREYAILMSTDGPYHNVLKIKPPMVFNSSNVDFLIDTMDKIFQEDFMRP